MKLVVCLAYSCYLLYFKRNHFKNWKLQKILDFILVWRSWLEDKITLQRRTVVPTAQAGSKGGSQGRNSRTWVLQADILDEHLGTRKANSINFPGLDSSPKCMTEFCLKYGFHFVKLNFLNTISHNFWLDLICSGKYIMFGRLLLLESTSTWHLIVAISAHR